MVRGKVSVIVTIYNGEKYLERCIRSVLKQDYRPLELVLINDGSKDNSEILCKKVVSEVVGDGGGLQYNEIIKKKIMSYCNPNDEINVKYFYQEDFGVSFARNVGINLSEGEHLMFVDDDDYLESKAISKLYDLYENTGADICCGSYYACFDRDKKNQNFLRAYQRTYVGKGKEEFMAACMGSNVYGNNEAVTNIGVCWAKLYKKEFLENNRIRFCEGLSNMEDSLFNITAAINASKIEYLNIPVYNYVIRKGSAVRRFRPDFSEMVTKFVNETNRVIKNNGLENSELLVNSLRCKRVAMMTEAIYLQILLYPGKISRKGIKKKFAKIYKKRAFVFNAKELTFLENTAELSKYQKIYFRLFIARKTLTLYYLLKFRYFVAGRSQAYIKRKK